MSSQQSNNPRPLRSKTGVAESQTTSSSNQLDMVLSRLSILDGIARDIAEIKQAQKELSDKLSSCVRSVEAHGKMLKQHASSLQQFSVELSVLKASHSVLKEDVSGLKNQLGSVDVVALEKVSLILKSEVLTLKDIAGSSISAAATGADGSLLYVNPVELLDRVKRANNLIVRNFPESVDVTTDKALILDIISKIRDGSPCDVIATRRLGNFRQGAPRLVKVEFSNPAVPANILCHRRVLAAFENYRRISIDDDKTPLQIKQLQDLRKELERKRSSGETDVTIKYRKGIPSIIKIPSSKN